MKKHKQLNGGIFRYPIYVMDIDRNFIKEKIINNLYDKLFDIIYLAIRTKLESRLEDEYEGQNGNV